MVTRSVPWKMVAGVAAVDVAVDDFGALVPPELAQPPKVSVTPAIASNPIRVDIGGRPR